MKKLSLLTLILVSFVLFPILALADIVRVTPVPAVPEPATLLFVASGLIGVLGLRGVFKK